MDENYKAVIGEPVVGVQAMAEAIFNDNPVIVRDILASGLHPDAKDHDNWPLIGLAAKYGSLESLEVLIEAGATIDNPLEDGQTPLILAANNSNQNSMLRLIQAGANINACGPFGPAINYAAIKGSDEILNLLLDHSAKLSISPNPTIVLAVKGMCSVDSVRRILDSGADVNTQDASGRSALAAATFSKDASIVSLLLDRGAVLLPDYEGMSPLDIAVERNRHEIAALIISSLAARGIPHDSRKNRRPVL